MWPERVYCIIPKTLNWLYNATTSSFLPDFSSTKKYESYDETLKVLAEAKTTTDNFFDNVIVNDKNLDIKKNRLELLQMFCKTYNNFADFSKVEGV